MVKKIAVVTGSRAEWGLLKQLEKKDSEFDLYLIATGSMANQVDVPCTNIEIVLNSDTPVGVCKSFGLGMISFADAYSFMKPDLVLLLGDRYETLVAATAAHICNIPIAHIHGGEESGNYDNAFRHAITHMATYHFTATEYAKSKVISLICSYKNVHCVGALGCEGLHPKPYPRENKILVVYHPTTLVNENFIELFDAIREIKEEIIFIRPNVDNGARKINMGIDGFLSSHQNAIAYDSLPREEYIDLLGRVKFIIGNSSSGIIEAPALDTWCINVGDRQKNRERSLHIFDVEMNKGKILVEMDFASRNYCAGYESKYKGGNVSEKIIEVLKSI